MFKNTITKLRRMLRPVEADLAKNYKIRFEAQDVVLRAIANSRLASRLVLCGKRIDRDGNPLLKDQMSILQFKHPRNQVNQLHDEVCELMDQLQTLLIQVPKNKNFWFNKDNIQVGDDVFDGSIIHFVYIPWEDSRRQNFAILIYYQPFGDFFEEPSFRAIPTISQGCIRTLAISPEESFVKRLTLDWTNEQPSLKLYEMMLLSDAVNIQKMRSNHTFTRLCQYEIGSLSDFTQIETLDEQSILERFTDWAKFHQQYPDVQGTPVEWAMHLRQNLERIIDPNDSASGAISPLQEWLSRDVVGLTQTMIAKARYDKLPILADALEEAGCDDLAMLEHCRADGPHPHGCYVIDRLREAM